MDRIGDLNLFLRVLDLGSISAAARSLDLSVAVASQRLQRLERSLGVPKKPDDLAKHECLLMAVGRDSTDSWHLRGPDGAETTVRLKSRVKSNLGEVIRDAALGGLGIAMHSTWHVSEDLRAGRLKLVLPDYQLPESAIYAVMPERRLVMPRVRAFVDFLTQQLGDTPPWERSTAKKPSVR